MSLGQLKYEFRKYIQMLEATGLWHSTLAAG